MEYKYAIVTPVKDEEKFLPITADSILKQTIQPQKWIIINDGSTDQTRDIINDLVIKYQWIQGVNNLAGDQELKRRIGGQAVIHLGLEKLNIQDNHFIVRMDSDVQFKSDFFYSIFKKFEKNPKLGIASGVCYIKEGSKEIEEKHPRFHTRGPLKIYKSECYIEINGLDKEEGWDTIDEIKANMLGWTTKSYPDLKVIHLRKTQSASGVLKGYRNLGSTAYYIGYHPVFMLLRCIYKMLSKPYLIGGIHMFFGFIYGYFTKQKRFDDIRIIRYMRKQQVNRLLGKESIWK